MPIITDAQAEEFQRLQAAEAEKKDAPTEPTPSSESSGKGTGVLLNQDFVAQTAYARFDGTDDKGNPTSETRSGRLVVGPGGAVTFDERTSPSTEEGGTR